MEDLLCSENLNTDRCTAGRDATMYTDARVLANLMLSEERNGVPPEDYFVSVQTDIKPYIRKIVNSWMQEGGEKPAYLPIPCLTLILDNTGAYKS
ncbi:hypothetical protein WDU94_011501 [Cyamophila willieti]